MAGLGDAGARHVRALRHGARHHADALAELDRGLGSGFDLLPLLFGHLPVA
jgi:hypothetical protein